MTHQATLSHSLSLSPSPPPALFLFLSLSLSLSLITTCRLCETIRQSRQDTEHQERGIAGREHMDEGKTKSGQEKRDCVLGLCPKSEVFCVDQVPDLNENTLFSVHLHAFAVVNRWNRCKMRRW